MGAVVQPLPTSHLIFRAPTNAAGKCWMDALELALRCSSLLATRKQNRSSFLEDSADGTTGLEEDEVEEHFKEDLDETGSLTSQDEAHAGEGLTEPSTHPSEEDGSEASEDNSVIEDVNVQPSHTNYTEDPPEVFGTVSQKRESPLYNISCSLRPGTRQRSSARRTSPSSGSS